MSTDIEDIEDMAAAGMSVARIAEELGVMENTVKQCLQYILQRRQEANKVNNEFANLYPEFHALMEQNMEFTNGTYQAPTKAAKFTSALLPEVMKNYERDLKPATVLRHMTDTIEIMKIDNYYLSEMNK